MPWQKTPNVAMFKGADWSNLIQQVPNCTPQLAKRIALRNPAITFFFLCNEPMYLGPTGVNPARQFNPATPFSSAANRGLAALLNAMRIRKTG